MSCASGSPTSRNTGAEFEKRYLQELRDKKGVLADLKILGKTNKKITLLFGAKNLEQNNAVVLCEALARMK